MGFLNDETFSEALLQTQKNSSSKGPKAIQQELQKKGIGKELQAKVLESYSEDEQLQIATKLAEKAANSNRSVAPAQLKQKIQNALLRKGYSFDIIKQALRTSTSIGKKMNGQLLPNLSGRRLGVGIVQNLVDGT